MNTTRSTPSPHAAFVPASPMTLSCFEISGDNMSQCHGWTTASATQRTVRLQL
jgi:hypothetical protein